MIRVKMGEIMICETECMKEVGVNREDRSPKD